MSQSKPVFSLQRTTSQKQVTVMLYGCTQMGKSTIGNTLLGCNDNPLKKIVGTISDVFTIGTGRRSTTKESSIQQGRYFDYETTVVDTPGFNDGAGVIADAQYFLGVTNILEKKNDIKMFFIIMNFNQPTFNGSMNLVFSSIVKMFLNKPWYEHVAILLTHCKEKRSDESIIEFVNEFQEDFIDNFKENVDKDDSYHLTDDQLRQIPIIPLDSYEARIEGTRSNKLLLSLLNDIYEKATIYEHLGQANHVELLCSTKREEKFIKTDKETIVGNRKTTYKSEWNRIITVYTDGTSKFEEKKIKDLEPIVETLQSAVFTTIIREKTETVFDYTKNEEDYEKERKFTTCWRFLFLGKKNITIIPMARYSYSRKYKLEMKDIVFTDGRKIVGNEFVRVKKRDECGNEVDDYEIIKEKLETWTITVDGHKKR